MARPASIPAWVLWHPDQHVHTNLWGEMKVFRSRKEAIDWKREHEDGGRGCKVLQADICLKKLSRYEG